RTFRRVLRFKCLPKSIPARFSIRVVRSNCWDMAICFISHLEPACPSAYMGLLWMITKFTMLLPIGRDVAPPTISKRYSAKRQKLHLSQDFRRRVVVEKATENLTRFTTKRSLLSQNPVKPVFLPYRGS